MMLKRYITPFEKTLSRDPSRQRIEERSGLSTSLIERQSDYKFDEHGTL
jgi:hypothetical protein